MIGKAIYNVLTTNSEVNVIISDRVYPNVLPINIDVPAVVYSIASDEPVKQKQGQSIKVTSNVNVKCLHVTYANVSALSKEVRLALDRLTGDIEDVYVEECYFDGATDLYDDENEIHQKILTFNFSYKY